VKARLKKYTSIQDDACNLCQTHEEDEDSLFFGCDLAKEVWNDVLK